MMEGKKDEGRVFRGKERRKSVSVHEEEKGLERR